MLTFKTTITRDIASVAAIVGLTSLLTGCQDRTPARDGAPVGQGGTIDADVGVDATAHSQSDGGATSDGGGVPDATSAAGFCPLPGCPQTTLPRGADLQGIWAGPSGEVWAVGAEGAVGRRAPDAQGGDWCWCSPGPDVAMNAVWGTSSSDVWMVGAGGTVLRFDGTGFTTIDVGTDAVLHDVWGSSAANVFVVGEQGTARRFDGAGWSTADVGATHTLKGIWGASEGAVWAVGRVPVSGAYDGAEAEIFRWDGAAGSFTRQAGFLEERGAAGFEGIGGSGPDDVWAVGHKFPSGAAAGFAFAARFDGTSWTIAEAPEEARIHRNYTDVDVAGTPGRPWITATGSGTSSTCVSYDGSEWTAAEEETANLLAIDASGDRIWAAGRGGKVMKRANGAWTVDLAAQNPVP